ncbi:16S rRNA (guanine(966)-N(2))-methyltransferase RsmD [Pseudooceanicola sp. CBS1P-1]|uniref:16S rRNA (Guanine(966)-N(2))-methyltransferase RsmD n=1 Tax=Pseudooceanicola albus TaxID=2692189 RepID=A0A6L7G8Y3_9RHOB|nr:MULTISPECIES: 16S rRNA (guanine(966)-N(2))-methyltransferase RsmD [Pseudooceanicola]MBT9384120.1 16S rRNA (guanine(966)-N(2))-methyltransferase RsmD [Pseudooceanicola endophyticus]MXN19780.1 16S rRNA (guanine(966)-N(2))-methyltransferase RsmD [Pseudooceanicola albus]
MRIIGGEFRGRRLAALGKGDAGAHLRPTTDRVRESLFSMLLGGRFGDPIGDAVVLDLFAGTGALGLEALSRGAARVTFVDDGRVAQKLIGANLAELGVKDRATLSRANATRLPPLSGDPATLVFLDPPYGLDLGGKALASAMAQGWIAPGALIIWEESSPQPAPEGFELLDTRRFGDTHVTFLERS